MTPTPRCAAGSIPTTVSGDTPARWRDGPTRAAGARRASPRPSRRPAPCARSAPPPPLAAVAGPCAARPGLRRPTPVAGQRQARPTIPVTTLAGERDRPPRGAGRRPAQWCSCGRSPATASSLWSAWPWPRAAWWPPPPTASRAAQHLHDRRRRSPLPGPRVVGIDTAPTSRWSACPTISRWRRSPTTPRCKRRRRHDPEPGAPPAAATVTLHCEAGIGDRHRHGDRQRVGQGHAGHHRPPRRGRWAAGRPPLEHSRAR